MQCWSEHIVTLFLIAFLLQPSNQKSPVQCILSTKLILILFQNYVHVLGMEWTEISGCGWVQDQKKKFHAPFGWVWYVHGDSIPCSVAAGTIANPIVNSSLKNTLLQIWHNLFKNMVETQRQICLQSKQKTRTEPRTLKLFSWHYLRTCMFFSYPLMGFWSRGWQPGQFWISTQRKKNP